MTNTLKSATLSNVITVQKILEGARLGRQAIRSISN